MTNKYFESANKPLLLEARKITLKDVLELLRRKPLLFKYLTAAENYLRGKIKLNGYLGNEEGEPYDIYDEILEEQNLEEGEHSTIRGIDCWNDDLYHLMIKNLLLITKEENESLIRTEDLDREFAIKSSFDADEMLALNELINYLYE